MADKYLEVKFLNIHEVYDELFEKLPNSKVVVSFYISISNLRDFQLLHILISICCY